MVYVLNRHGKPLMPTNRYGHVRKLLKSGKAVPIRNNPFTIKLKYDTPDIVQDLYLGIDPGRENIGIGVSKTNGTCVFLSELKTNNRSIKKQMDNRRSYHRARRHHKRLSKQRKALRDGTAFKTGTNDALRSKRPCKARTISYPKMDDSVTCKAIKGSEAQFANRKKRCALTPSGRQLLQMHFHAIDAIRQILPISHIILERNTFDFQKMDDINIRNWQYQKGPLYGYANYKDYIRQQQHGRCLSCGTNKIEQYHHIKPLSKGGSNTVRNIAGLCDSCHNGTYGVHKDADASKKLETLKSGLYARHKVSLLNSVMPELIEQLDAYCHKKGISFYLTDGYETHATRRLYGLPKKHCIDGFCISLAGRKITNVTLPEIVHIQQRFKKKSAANISKLNYRGYYDTNGRLVARNRRKAEGQTYDSLEEHMEAYGHTHTADECTEHLKSLQARPAKRTYFTHRNGRWCPIHTGDTVRYEKNGVQPETFVTTSVKIMNNAICHETKKKAIKFCKKLTSSCTPFIRTETV